jgi:hypothetical protein
VAFVLGGAQREARATSQFFAGYGVLRGPRDADAGGDLPHSIDKYRPQQRRAQRSDKCSRLLGVVATQNDREFVILEAPE